MSIDIVEDIGKGINTDQLAKKEKKKGEKNEHRGKVREESKADRED